MAGPVIITGGGTGGHVFPMQAIAEALRQHGLSGGDLRFVGSRRGQERRLLGGGDVALTLLPGRGLQRSRRVADLGRNVAATLGLLVAVLGSLFLVKRWRPSVVVSVGGYASFAVSFAARCWGTPLVLVELDATPGAAQRRFARYAAKRCCAFPSPGENVVVTGAPLREAIEHLDRSPEARVLAKAAATPPIEPEQVVVVVMSGSLGALRVNEAVSELATRWASRRDRAILHVTGQRDYERVRSRAPSTSGLDYRVVAFADMVELWGVCDVAVCRAGATTVAELTALSIPSILVPLAGAPDDHQTKNADAVVRAGGAVLLRNDQCTGEALDERLEKLAAPATWRAMSLGAGTLARPGAARAIAAVIVELRAGP
jgi:UDP-N-acetylglucosamine--N-acetylmuramyl-(pentapeptide) pyrophosphoryl-undecaprenol N-acetylglucosamine transferase